MADLRESLNAIRHYARIIQDQHSLLEPQELTDAATLIEEQSELALQSLDDAGTHADDPATAAPSNNYGLSGREREVLAQVALGLADKQIAAALGISTFTVNKHVSTVLQKMGAESRTQAGVRAIRENLV